MLTLNTSKRLTGQVDGSNTLMQVDFLGESTTGNLRFVQRVTTEGLINVLGMQQLDDIETIPYTDLKRSQQVRPLPNVCLSLKYLQAF